MGQSTGRPCAVVAAVQRARRSADGHYIIADVASRLAQLKDSCIASNDTSSAAHCRLTRDPCRKECVEKGCVCVRVAGTNRLPVRVAQHRVAGWLPQMRCAHPCICFLATKRALCPDAGLSSFRMAGFACRRYRVPSWHAALASAHAKMQHIMRGPLRPSHPLYSNSFEAAGRCLCMGEPRPLLCLCFYPLSLSRSTAKACWCGFGSRIKCQRGGQVTGYSCTSHKAVLAPHLCF